jgi:hypothetical protein
MLGVARVFPDAVVERREVRVERLRDRPTGQRLHVLRQRLEALGSRPADGVDCIDHGHALQPVDRGERIRDRRLRDGEQNRARARCVAAFAAHLDDLVAGPAPEVSEPAAHVALPIVVIRTDLVCLRVVLRVAPLFLGVRDG